FRRVLFRSELVVAEGVVLTRGERGLARHAAEDQDAGAAVGDRWEAVETFHGSWGSWCRVVAFVVSRAAGNYESYDPAPKDKRPKEKARRSGPFRERTLGRLPATAAAATAAAGAEATAAAAAGAEATAAARTTTAGAAGTILRLIDAQLTAAH